MKRKQNDEPNGNNIKKKRLDSSTPALTIILNSTTTNGNTTHNSTPTLTATPALSVTPPRMICTLLSSTNSILSYVLSYLEHHHVCQLAQVCKWFMVIFNSDRVWKYQHEDMLKKLSNLRKEKGHNNTTITKLISKGYRGEVIRNYPLKQRFEDYWMATKGKVLISLTVTNYPKKYYMKENSSANDDDKLKLAVEASNISENMLRIIKMSRPYKSGMDYKLNYKWLFITRVIYKDKNKASQLFQMSISSCDDGLNDKNVRSITDSDIFNLNPNETTQSDLYWKRGTAISFKIDYFLKSMTSSNEEGNVFDLLQKLKHMEKIRLMVHCEYRCEKSSKEDSEDDTNFVFDTSFAIGKFVSNPEYITITKDTNNHTFRCKLRNTQTQRKARKKL